MIWLLRYILLIRYCHEALQLDELICQLYFGKDRSSEKIAYVDAYLKAVGMFRNFNDSNEDPVFSAIYGLDLSTVVPSLSGPKRPQDRVPASEMKSDFQLCLRNKVDRDCQSSITIPFLYNIYVHLLKTILDNLLILLEISNDEMAQE